MVVVAAELVGDAECAPAPVKELGFGIVDELAHFFMSYFVRMKFSIFRASGTYPSGNLASQ